MKQEITYITSGKRVWRDYHMPLVYLRDIFLAEHRPDLCQLIYADTGELMLKEDGNTIHYPAPAVLLIGGKNSIREIQAVKALGHNFIFTPDALNSNYCGKADWSLDPAFFFLKPFINLPAKGYSCLTLPSEYRLRFVQLCDKLDLSLNRQEMPELWPCLSRSFFMEILILIERISYLSNEHKELFIPETGTKIDEIFMFMHTHYHEKITLEGLCSRFATNRTTLNRLFQDICGMSAIAYLNHIRMEMAVSVLKNTLLPLSQVAERVGINDLSYFARTFRKKTGISPSAFRKSVQSPYTAAY